MRLRHFIALVITAGWNVVVANLDHIEERVHVPG
jgi:hypothetical protein